MRMASAVETVLNIATSHMYNLYIWYIRIGVSSRNYNKSLVQTLAARRSDMRIRSIMSKDIEPACHLIRETYIEFNYGEGTVDATNEYLDAYNPDLNLDSLKKSFGTTPICYVATEKNEVVGIVRGFHGRLINLFVDGRHHRKGIGGKLLGQFERRCREDGQNVIKVNISIFSIPFYEANGYKKTTGIRNKKGLKIQPMKKRLTSICTTTT